VTLARTALPIVTVLVFVVVTVGSLWAGAAAGTLGYDFLAYQHAANRVVNGLPLYDPSIQQAGGFGLFLYPPPFILLILPFASLDPNIGTWIWSGLLLALFLAGVALLPVKPIVRWLIVLLAGLSWPFEYGLRLGQVGPLLFLLFAIGWHWLRDPRAVGASAAAGTMIKLQPGLLLVWAALTRRWGAAVIGLIILAVVALVASVVAGGPNVWFDYVTILRNVSDPITTPHNFTPGAVAYQIGVPASVATWIQIISSVAVAGVMIVAAMRASATASFLATVIASQLLSPVLWDHYAMLLLLPVAYLLDRGQWWSVAIPLATSIFIIGIAPPIAYPIEFWVALVAVVFVGSGEGVQERNVLLRRQPNRDSVISSMK
jgi:Glycosyltransferase family 87